MDNIDIKKVNVPVTVVLIAAFSFLTWLITWSTGNGEKNQQLVQVQSDVTALKLQISNMQIDIGNLKSTSDINVYKINSLSSSLNEIKINQDKVLSEIIEMKGHK